MDSLYPYLTRIVPALSLIGIVFLVVSSFVVAPYANTGNRDRHGEATTSQLILTVYTVFLHVLSLTFASRVCWALGDVVRGIEDNAKASGKSNGHKGRLGKDSGTTGAHEWPKFVIIIPAYNEEIETLQETIRVLASHPRARHSYHIYLAMEQREQNAVAKASNLVEVFRASIYKISYTVHPSRIPGEAAGKSSNESWAARQAFQDYRNTNGSNVVMTIMDADTHLSPRYFAQVAKHHIDNPNAMDETIYVPPMVFDRNMQHIPLPVRTADIMWAGAGLSNLYTGSSVCIPTSVYSLPMSLAEKVGGWDTGPGAIGEDMHMYLKCFFALSANLRVKIIYASASQCNVSSNLEGINGFVDGLRARYNQALRHMWGAVDTGYAIRQAVDMAWKSWQAGIPISSHSPKVGDMALWKREIFQIGTSAVCTFNWIAPNASIGGSNNTTHKQKTHPKSQPRKINLRNLLTLFHRLFEAHFLPLHLSLILATATIYETLPTAPLPPLLSTTLHYCSLSRWLGWALIVTFFYRYQTYHRLCVQLRKDDLRAAGMEDEAEDERNFSPEIFRWCGVVEAGVFPLGGFLFGAIPALQAVLCHIFTERIVYRVSLKPRVGMGYLKDKAELVQQAASPQRAEKPSHGWVDWSPRLGFGHVVSALRFRPVKAEE